MRKKGIFVLLLLVVIVSYVWAQAVPGLHSGEPTTICAGQMSLYERINLVICSLSLLVLVGGLLYAGLQLRSLRKIHADNHKWNRKKAAQDVIFKITELADHTIKLNEKIKHIDTAQPIPVPELKQIFKDNPNVPVILHHVLNHYEGLARGVYKGIYDEDIIKTARKGTMIRVYRVFRDYIEDKRNEHETNKKIYEQFEAIVNKWEQERTHIPKPDLVGERDKQGKA